MLGCSADETRTDPWWPHRWLRYSGLADPIVGDRRPDCGACDPCRDLVSGNEALIGRAANACHQAFRLARCSLLQPVTAPACWPPGREIPRSAAAAPPPRSESTMSPS